jgi:hypothetical protein
MIYLQRNHDVMTGKKDLEVLHTFPQFPVYMGAVDCATSEDEFADMTWTISRSSGMIQLNPVLPLEVVYQQSHGSGTIGELWKEHHKAFALFIHRFAPQKVLEIGGGHGYLHREYQLLQSNNWTIVEPNPNPDLESKVNVIKTFFDKNVELPDEIDAIVHSHVLEHIYEPREFFENLNLKLEIGKMLFFSVPNMEEMLKRKYLNCLNFEHTIMLTGVYIEHLLALNGFKLLNVQRFYDDHSIFYAAEKVKECEPIMLNRDLYKTNRRLVNDYMDHYRERVASMNYQIISSGLPTYIFGAHVFTQYLFAFGLQESLIKGIFDNDPRKQGKRLSGTNLNIFSPDLIRGTKNHNVLLSAGVYNQEIMAQIYAYDDTKVNLLL